VARPGPFDYFVIFAEMRTGSNFLELNLRKFPDLNTFGEAFNPDFLGYPDWPDLFGMTMAMREADPLRLIRDMSDQAKQLPGFRYFFDHDPRVLDELLTKVCQGCWQNTLPCVQFQHRCTLWRRGSSQ